MNAPSPHFLLFSEAGRTLDRGQWRFVLESLDGTDKLEAGDIEPNVHGERLELLAVVRGLEALPGPSKVTLVTPSQYVNRGLHFGLAEWRSNDWQWEHFGEMAPIKNRDLWQRVDRALEFHSVNCRLWRLDGQDAPPNSQGETKSTLAGPHFLKPRPDRREPAPSANNALAVQTASRAMLKSACERRMKSEAVSRLKSLKPGRIRRRLGSQIRRRRIKLMRSIYEFWESFCLRWRQFGSRLAPPPWLD